MAKIETVNYTNETFKTYLMALSTNIIWKNTSLAKKYETNADPYLSELFITANRGVLSFEIVRAFPRAVLQSIGIPEAQVDEYASDKTKIPLNKRSLAVKEYQNALCSINPSTGRHGYETKSGWVSVYEEQNDYYRMLNGLPSINDTTYVYNTNQKYPTDTPVHELSLVTRLEMEEDGTMAKLISENPSAEYLKYCGSKMISIYKARVANRFEILHRNSIDSSTLEDDFDSVYESCANLINSVYYSDAFKKTNTLYENFLAMCIIFMTIQTMQYHYLSVDTIRDFYDTESLKYVYDSYNIPFYNEIPLEYHRKIVKNINKLIGYKGSSQVFFDLFDIFDTDMNIYAYYLTKVHRFDENGNPEFNLKTDDNGEVVYDKNGNPVLASSNYDIAFARGEIYEDPSLSVADPINKSEYYTIIGQDSYWVEDTNVRNVINDASFNFNETKYIGVQTTFDLLKITYENAYLFKMIMDNKSITDRLILQWPDLEIEASFYDIFIYLAAIVCEFHGYEGNISSNLPYTAAVLGYDFKKSATIIKDYIENNSYLRSNTELREKIRSMNITNVNSVNSTFSNMKDIESMLVDGYVNATSKEEFEAYRNLYNTLMTSQIIDEVYTLSDGTLASSFSELLKSQSPDLYARYLGVAEGDIESELTVIIDKLEDNLISLKYAPHSLGIESSSLIENLFRILSFFKSAKAEIIGYNVIYKITGRGINFFRFMDKLISGHVHTITEGNITIIDFILHLKNLLKLKNDGFDIHDSENTLDNIFFSNIDDQLQHITDILKCLFQVLPSDFDNLYFIDFFMKNHSSVSLNDNMESKEAVDLVDHYFIKGDPIYTFDDIKVLIDNLIILNALPHILTELDMKDLFKIIYEKIETAIKMNASSLMQYDEMSWVSNGELSITMNDMILQEYISIYNAIFKEKDFLIIDKFINDTYLLITSENGSIKKETISEYLTCNSLSDFYLNILSEIERYYGMHYINSSNNLTDSIRKIIQDMNLDDGYLNIDIDSVFKYPDSLLKESEIQIRIVQESSELTDCFLDSDNNPLV